MLQHNVIYEWIIAYKEPLCQTGSFLSLWNLFSINGSLELSKEPYASYIEPQWTLFSESVQQQQQKITYIQYKYMLKYN